MSTQQIFEPATKGGFASVGRFPITIDGYFFVEDPTTTYEAGRQAHVQLLAGWNSEEMTWLFLLRGQEPSLENYKKAVQEAYGANADDVLKAYPASTPKEVIVAATDLASDRSFLQHGIGLIRHRRTGGNSAIVLYARARPPMKPERGVRRQFGRRRRAGRTRCHHGSGRCPPARLNTRSAIFSNKCTAGPRTTTRSQR
jgi:para-nitrobenzyl esterase